MPELSSLALQAKEFCLYGVHSFPLNSIRQSTILSQERLRGLVEHERFHIIRVEAPLLNWEVNYSRYVTSSISLASFPQSGGRSLAEIANRPSLDHFAKP